MPHRVLPVSSEPPQDIQLLIDDEFSQIEALLRPGRRRTAEASVRIRSLLAMEAHLGEGVRVSTRDVDQVQRQVKKGKSRSEVFPRLDTLGSEVAGGGVTLTVRFSKTTGAPVRYVADEDVPAAALREVDRQQRFHWTVAELAARCGLTPARCLALRRHLGIEDDPTMVHDFVFGTQHHRRYSDKADRLLRETVDSVDMDDIWEKHRPRRSRD